MLTIYCVARFVRDDVTFDDEPTDQVTAASADLESYKPGEFVTAALRDSKVKLTWDQDDPERLKLVRGSHPSKDKKQKGKGKKEEEIDYSTLLASDSEDDVTARNRMRAAFGLGEEPAEGDEGDSEDDVDMEVTFGPALDGEGEGADDDEDGEKEETSLEAYQRKERERRLKKKEKRLAEKKKSAGHGRVVFGEDDDSDPDEAFDANAFGEADGLDSEEGGADAFFEHEGQEADGQSAGEEVATSAKLSKKAQKQLEKEAKAKEAAQLSLLVGGSDGEGDESGDDGRHFDMQAILRAEKQSSKPKKMLKKGKDRRKHEDAKKLLQREEDKFEIDLKDDRFTKLHEDHEFALDPSNAKYVIIKLDLLERSFRLTLCAYLSVSLDTSRRRTCSVSLTNPASDEVTRRLSKVAPLALRAAALMVQVAKMVCLLLLNPSRERVNLHHWRADKSPIYHIRRSKGLLERMAIF